MNQEFEIEGVFSNGTSKSPSYGIAKYDDGTFSVFRSVTPIDYEPGSEISGTLEFLVDLTQDDGKWTQDPDSNFYRFSNRDYALFVAHRLVSLKQGAIDRATHLTTLRLSLVLAELHTGKGSATVSIVDSSEVVRLERLPFAVENEDPIEMFLLVHLASDNIGTTRRRFLCTRSSVTSGEPEWTDNLNEARWFFARSHALDSAHWILERGSIGYHAMGNPADTLYQRMAEEQYPRLRNLQFTDDKGRESSLCFIQVKTKSITKTGMKRDVSGADDSKSSGTSDSDPEMARWMFKNRAGYVYLLVQFNGETLRRYQVDSFSRSNGVYSVTGREIVEGSSDLGDSLSGTVVDYNRRRELSDDHVVMVDSGDEQDISLDPLDYLDEDEWED